jgi:hypothetical protein
MRSPKLRKAERGSALITTMVMMGVILGVVTALMAFANAERLRAITVARKNLRISCAESGLQFAKAYFGRRFQNWGTYLSNPSTYDPIPSLHNGWPADYTNPVFQDANADLFADLDGDGERDVYIYARDNQDEFPPLDWSLPTNWDRDNDQNIIVGAICISKTLGPRPVEDPMLMPNPLTAEALLSYNTAIQGCTQAGCGDGSNSLNN